MKTAPKPEWKVICETATGKLDIISRECPEGWVTVYTRSGSGYLALESILCQCCEYDEAWHELCPDFVQGADWAENAGAVERLGANIAARLAELKGKEAI